MMFSTLIKARMRFFWRAFQPRTMAASSRQLNNLRFLWLLLLIVQVASLVPSNSVIASTEATEGLINGGISETNTNYGAGAPDGHITFELAVGDAHLHGNAWGLQSGTSTVRSRFNLKGTHMHASSLDTHDPHHGAASTPPTPGTPGLRSVTTPAPVVENSKPQRPSRRKLKEPSKNVRSLLRNLEEEQLPGPPDMTPSENDSAGPPAVENQIHDQLQQEQNKSRPVAAYSDLKETGPVNLGGGSICNARECVLIEQTSIGLNSMYSVQVLNVCSCTVCHLCAYCPGFVSTVAIDPKVFQRLPDSPDNCRVNNGYPIPPGGGIRFTYGGSFPTVIQPSTSASCFRRRRAKPPPG